MMILNNAILGNITRTLVAALAASLLVLFPGGPTPMAYATSADCSAFGLNGDGTPQDPMRITSSANLLSISDCVSANPGAGLTYEVVNDIDMSGLGEISPLPSFEGSLVGDGQLIHGFSISGDVGTYAGLFAQASGSASVMNLSFRGTVENTANSGGNTGLLFGHALGGLTAVGVGIQGTISETVAGGTRTAGFLAGTVDGLLSIDSSTVTQATINADATVIGGLVGEADEVEMSSATATRLVIDASSAQSSGYYGGLIGYATTVSGLVDNTFVEEISIEAASGGAGGVFGNVANSSLEIDAAQVRYSSISISDGIAGGVAGYVEFGVTASGTSIDHSSITSGGDNVGGLFGFIGGGLDGMYLTLESVTISTGEDSSNVGGLAGYVVEDSNLMFGSVQDLLVPRLKDRFGGVIGTIANGGLDATNVGVVSVSATSVDQSQALMGGFVGTLDQNFTASMIVLMDTTLTGTGSFLGGHVGYIANGGYTADMVYLGNTHVESEDAGSVGGLVGSLDLNFTLSSAELEETAVFGNGQFVAGAVGYVANGILSVSDYVSTISTIVNSSNMGQTAGIAGGVEDGVSMARVSLRDMAVEAGGNFVSFAVGFSANGPLSATDISIANSDISISDTVNYVGGVVGGLDGADAELSDISLESVNIHTDGSFAAGVIGNAGGNHVSASNITLRDFTITNQSNNDFMAGILAAGQSVSFSDITLDNVLISSAPGDWIGGLVGQTPGAQDFSRITIEGLEVIGYSRVGGIAGGISSNNPSNFIDITISDATISGLAGGWVGGLSGTMDGGSIADIVGSNLTVNGDSRVGGLVGAADASISFENIELENTSVSGTTDSVGGVGGVMYGPVAVTQLTMSFTTITAETKIGGVFGFTTDSVTGSHIQLTFTALVSNDTNFDGRVGGLIGFATTRTVSLHRVGVGFIYVNSQTTKVGGVVGWATSGVSISDFAVQGAVLTAASYVGAVIGYTTNGFSAERGYLDDNTIEATLGYAGGLVGFSVNSDNTISQLVMLSTDVTTADYAGGLIGYTTQGTTVTDAEISASNVVGTGDYAGGVAGFGVGTLSVSRAILTDVNVGGTNYVGGLIGQSILGAHLQQVLLNGLVATGSSDVGDYIGELSGDDHLLRVTQSYAVLVQSSSSPIALISGSTGSAQVPEEITATASFDVATFVGWDFNTYFGLRCDQTPASVGVRAVSPGLLANCSAPSTPNQSTPVSFVYEGPIFSSISPSLISTASSIILTGSKLDLVGDISVDGIKLTFTRISSTQLELFVPAGFSLGKKDLRVEHSLGSLLVSNAFEVVAPPVVILPKVTITNYKGSVRVYFKHVAGRALVVKVGGNWHRVANDGREVVSFTRKVAKGKAVQVSAYLSGVKIATNKVFSR